MNSMQKILYLMLKSSHTYRHMTYSCWWNFQRQIRLDTRTVNTKYGSMSHNCQTSQTTADRSAGAALFSVKWPKYSKDP